MGPYLARDRPALRFGTLDKIQVKGHYYSDKSPVPAVLLAGWYWLLRTWTGWTAAARPAWFVRWMTLASSGLAYVVAVWCIDRMGRVVGLPPGRRLLLTASFGLATMAPCYARQANNHVLLLAAGAAVVLGLARLAEDRRAGRLPWGRLAGLGLAAGFGYTTDLGAGPVLLLCTGAVVAWRCRRPAPVMVFGLAALPGLVLHHAVNYAVGGTLGPANAVPEYFRWPGCPFTPASLTGAWKHAGVGPFLLYAGGMLFGKRGLVGHNLPLFLVLPALVGLLRRRRPESPEVCFAAGWIGGTWLLYAATSNNCSGLCC
jgi:hypothetical protein